MYDKIIEQNICFINADSDKQIYYYCAAAPTIIISGDNTPAVQFQIFRNSEQPSDVYYAMLSLQTQLSSSAAAAQAAASANPNIPSDAILLPLQVIACSATLNIPQLIPSLTNNTSLSSQQLCYLLAGLTKTDDIVLLTALLRSPESAPIAVSYKVDYLQQLPPSTFELEAQWGQVYQYLKTSVGFNALIFSVNIETISEQLISNKVVTIKVRSTDPNSHIEEAGVELTQILTSEFFTPVFSKVDEQSHDGFGFYLQKVSVEDIEQRSLSGKLTETTVVKRSLYPQALFADLVKGSDYRASDVIKMNDIKDDFFAYRTVTANLIASELDDNIQLVVATLNYGSTSLPLIFSRDDPSAKVFKVPSIIDEKTKTMVWPVSYQFTLYFNQAIGGVTSIQSEKMVTSLTEIYLDVESLYSRYDFVIKAENNFNWQWYQSILVTIKCSHLQDKNNNISKSFQITQQSLQDKYSVMLPEPDLYQFEVTKQYSKADNSSHISANIIEPTSQDVFIFSSLYKQRVLKILASFDWEEVLQAIVYVSYNYLPANPSAVLQQNITFTESNATPQLFSADQLDPALLTVNLSVLITYKQGKPAWKQTSTDQNQIDIANLA